MWECYTGYDGLLPGMWKCVKKDGKKAMISIIAAIATVLIVLLVGIVVWQFQIIKDQSDNAEKDVKEQSAQQNEDSGKEETTQEEKPTITPAKEARRMYRLRLHRLIPTIFRKFLYIFP